MNRTHCKNCGQDFKGNFCYNCGQAADTHQINLKFFFHEIQHGLLHIDKGILYTTKQLFTRPGHSIRDYIIGKRVNHFKPIAFVFIVCTIYALLSKISKENTFLDDIALGFSNAEKDKQLPFDTFTKTLNWLKQHYAYSVLLIIPFFSIASYLAFFKSKYNFLQHIILNCYAIGQKTIVYILIIPITYLVNNKDFTENVQSLEVIIGVILTFWTYAQFFINNSKTKSIFLTVLTYLLLVICFLLVVIVLSIITGLASGY
jgi:hypothetical protein